jgi:TonB family protein
MLALPAGIVGYYFTGVIERLSSSSEIATKFFVVENPITVTVTANEPTVGFSDPMLWIGILGGVVLLGSLFSLIRMFVNALMLKQIGKNLDFTPLPCLDNIDLTLENIRQIQKTSVAFSEETNIPYTYGWFATKIVIPADLRDDPDKCTMAIQHELMHIKHRDFLLNGILMVVKALFWFHPLTHYLHSSGQEYREITCDGEVLAGNRFSKKRYAALLFELAEREYRNSQLAVSMAVNPSTLKKRIKIMATQNISTATFRSSFLLTLVTAGLIALTISCSDIADGGITNSELQEAQSQIATQSNNERPLYVLNGEQLKSEEQISKIGFIKPKYIKSISVLKGEEAVSKYGEAGKNGVVEISMWEETVEKAFSDLKAPPPPQPSTPEESGEAEPQEDYFVAVEKMPELVGGLKSIQRKVNYPQMARQAGIEGRVIVQFIVNEQGDVENPQIIRGIGGGCDEEALRVVKQAKFNPGKQRGQPVSVQYSLPIVFQLQKAESENELPSSRVENPEVEGSNFEIKQLRNSSPGTLSGRIIDKNTGEPLAGANIIVNDTSIGSASDREGNFQLQNIPPGDHEISVSYVGYNRTTLHINIE